MRSIRMPTSADASLFWNVARIALPIRGAADQQVADDDQRAGHRHQKRYSGVV